MNIQKYFKAGLMFAVLLSHHAVSETTASEKNSDEFIFDQWPGKSLKVFLALPEEVRKDTPIVIVLHGNSRNAKTYRDAWEKTAIEENAIVVVPEFSAWDYPKRQYILGNMSTPSGKPVAPDQWVFAAIEPLFDQLRKQLGTEVKHYSLYGHSAGAQVAHRLLYFVPDNRAQRIVLANAGFYTIPVSTVDYPQGLGGVEVSDDSLKKAYAKRVIILLGDRDNNPQHKSLNRELESLRQGPHRFSRGHNFYNNSLFKASMLLKVPFNWSLSIAPGVSHSNQNIIPFAAPLLLGGPLVVN